MKILLDTHILLQSANKSLDPTRVILIENPKNTLFFSQISLWEIAKLYELGRLSFTGSDGFEKFIKTVSNHPEMRAVDLKSEILVEIPKLSIRMHKDPADQIIVATAMVERAALMTDDRLIRKLNIVDCI